MSAVISVGQDGAATIGSFTASGQTSPGAMAEARRFKDWTFHLTGTISAGGITVQGSIDNGASYFDLVPDSVNTSTGQNVNPLTDTNSEIRYKGSLTQVRGVSNAAFTGSVVLKGYAVP
jgi:hypothetical protein